MIPSENPCLSRRGLTLAAYLLLLHPSAFGYCGLFAAEAAGVFDAEKKVG